MTGTSSSQAANPGSTVTGTQIATQAQTYVGHAYSYGGYEADTSGWDCSSFVSWVLCHDLKLPIPGYAAGAYDGSSHGPVTQTYLTWSGATTESLSASGALEGDLCCWETHIGIAVGSGNYVSAYDASEGTVVKPISSGGPVGEVLVVRRMNGTTPGGAAGSTTSLGILGSLESIPSLFNISSYGDLLQRAGLIIFGALLLIVGIIIMFPKVAHKAETLGATAVGGPAAGLAVSKAGSISDQKRSARAYNKSAKSSFDPAQDDAVPYAHVKPAHKDLPDEPEF